MYIDRLRELRSKAGLNSTRPSTPMNSSDQETLHMFFGVATAAQSTISDLSRTVGSLETARVAFLTSTTPLEEAEATRQINETTASLNKLLRQAKAAVAEVTEELSAATCDSSRTESSRTDSSRIDGSPFDKIKKNVHATLIRRLREVLIRLQSLESEISVEQRNRAVRHLMLTAGEDEDECRRLVDLGVTAQKAVRMEFDENQRLKLQNVQGALKEVSNMEKAIADLNRMFIDLAVLVDQQAETLDSIEFLVVNTKNCAHVAGKAVVTAAIKQRKSLKLAIWLLISCIILAAVIILPLIFTDVIRGSFAR